MRRPETQLVPSSSPVPARRPEDFPPDVHGSLATLRAIAKQAKSRTDPGLRWATDEEIALAVALQKPGMCTAHSSRTGLPCEKRRLEGANVCQTHGAGTKVARAAVTRRLQAIAMPLVSRQKELAMQSDNLTVAQKATADLLDRGGVGALVEAKVRQSLKAPATTVFDNKTHISIGFLESRPGDPPCAESENAVVWTNAQAYAEYEAGRQAKLAAIDTEVVQNGE